MEQAQTLLCVSGAMMMIIIGNNLARAFGIAGAASIIRFRTPVDDPKDVTILFLLMGLGMSTGLGQFAVAGLGTAFLCVALLAARPDVDAEGARDVGRNPRGRASVPDHARRKRVRPQSDRVRAARDLAVRRRDGEVPHVAGSADVARGPERPVDDRGRWREVRGLGTSETGSRMIAPDAPLTPDRLVSAVEDRRAALLDVIRQARSRITLSLFRCNDKRDLRRSSRRRPRAA